MNERLETITDPDERRRAVALLTELEQLGTVACRDCRQTVCGHQYVMSAAMGFKARPRCPACLARALELPLAGFLERVRAYIDRRACFRTAWDRADEAEGCEGQDPPPCLAAFFEDGSAAPTAAAARSAETAPSTETAPRTEGGQTATDMHWDAGDMSCGDLVLELRIRLARLDGGDLFELTATDPAAREDIPAWCNLTGNRLLRAVPPRFWIRRKDQPTS